MWDLGLLGLAFSAGILAFVNPCAFPLLPAYLSYLMGKSEDKSGSENTLGSAFRGFKHGAMAVFGFFLVFGSIGLLVSLVGSQVKQFLPIFLLIVSPVLILMGFFWILGKSNLYFSRVFSGVKLSRSSFFLFGATYALVSLACVFPIFISLVSTAIAAGGFLSGFAVFLSYTLGMGGMMVFATIAVKLSKEFVIRSFRGASKYMKKIAGIILVAAGAYLLFHWYVVYGITLGG